MAVTFKVPKSPSRDIALTDTFMGVDLTNTGANIDGYRSPHAPNMVRLVPGKVRKRMGYYKEILFGTDENVNFADGTSASEKEIHIGSLDVGSWVKIYDLIQELKSENDYTLYLEFDYKSEADFNILNATTIVTASEEWEHISTSVECLSTDTFSDVKIFSDDPQNIYIKNFAILKTRTDSYEWSPAPKYFVERETNDPVYGCHYLRNDTDAYEGDRVTNVNRALETSSSYEDDPRYTLGECPGTGTTCYLEFDYTCEAEGHVSFLDYSTVFPSSSELAHFSYSHVVGDSQLEPDPHVSIWSEPGVNVKVKNFSFMYAMDENYKWSPAPEDIGEKFFERDLYNVERENKSITESGSDEKQITVSGTCSVQVQEPNATERITGLTHVSFDVTTSDTAGKLEGLYVELEGGVLPGSGDAVAYSSDGHLNNKHIDVYLSLGQISVNWVSVYFVVSGSTKVKAEFSNIKVQKYSVRTEFYHSPKWYIYHVGKDLYLSPSNFSYFENVYSNANEHISQSFQINDNSYIIDGKNYYEFSIKDGERVVVVDQENAYIPTITKAREYNGGGVTVDAFNLLQPGFIEQFIGVATQRTYQLSQSKLDATEVKAWILDSNGNWNPKEEDTDFSVDRITGKVTFVTAPGVTPLEGEDSIRIQAYKTFEDYRSRITKCRFGTLYGVSGAADRIFLSGNPEHPNWDFYSQYKDGTYFPDIGYSTLGSSQSAITGYAIVSNYLATFKDGFDQSQSVFVREGDMLVVDEENKTSEPVFKLINSLQGVGSISPYSFGYLQTEPVFLTKAGIYAITEQDITGEKYSQNRSFYLDGKLRKEPNLSTAFATVHDNQYILALNGQLYVLDGLQATRTDKSEPYATRQYAGFYCTDIPANILWEDDAVCFGTNDGKVCRFYTDVDALSSYNDDGKPIYSCWETPDLDGKLFYKNKTFRYMAVRLMQAIKTSVKLYSRRFGLWTLNDETAWNFIKEQTSISNMLDFENFDFNLLSFSADLTERLVHTKLRVKKVDKARFRVENGELDEPFGLFDLALEYIESGNYKG